MDGNGFQGNLKYLRGEYDFLVNKYAADGKTAVELSPESFVLEASPTKRNGGTRTYFTAKRAVTCQEASPTGAVSTLTCSRFMPVCWQALRQ